ncbi:MAG: type II toxin-antitoxin system RelE/ParE family toxin [Sulfurovum sp.]|nr:type II toxin-antitoxin system RelE/ParE family toxin [Sulfurovum sp.]
MQIIHLPRFYEELEVIVDFIADESINQAIVFLDKLTEKILDIPDYPHSYRQRKDSKYSESRELIYKGYCVPFYIDEENDAIVILGIYNQNLWNED